MRGAYKAPRFLSTRLGEALFDEPARYGAAGGKRGSRSASKKACRHQFVILHPDLAAS